MEIDPIILARLSSFEAAEVALRKLGGKLSPAHDRLWLIPNGKLRQAKKIASLNNYPAAFKITDWRASK